MDFCTHVTCFGGFFTHVTGFGGVLYTLQVLVEFCTHVTGFGEFLYTCDRFWWILVHM